MIGLHAWLIVLHQAASYTHVSSCMRYRRSGQLVTGPVGRWVVRARTLAGVAWDVGTFSVSGLSVLGRAWAGLGDHTEGSLVGGPAGVLRSGASAGWSSWKRRRLGSISRYVPTPGRPGSTEDYLKGSSGGPACHELGCSMWGFGWPRRAVHRHRPLRPGTGSSVLYRDRSEAPSHAHTGLGWMSRVWERRGPYRGLRAGRRGSRPAYVCVCALDMGTLC